MRYQELFIASADILAQLMFSQKAITLFAHPKARSIWAHVQKIGSDNSDRHPFRYLCYAC